MNQLDLSIISISKIQMRNLQSLKVVLMLQGAYYIPQDANDEFTEVNYPTHKVHRVHPLTVPDVCLMMPEFQSGFSNRGTATTNEANF